MFTGLVETTGQIQELAVKEGITTVTVSLGDAALPFDVATGDSVAINGCCLTVTEFDAKTLQFDVSRETLARTNLGALEVATSVNLERALRLGDRLGGHMVSGHVDGSARLVTVDRQSDGWDVVVELAPDLARYVIPKGSICLDGVSLTVNSVSDDPKTGQCQIHLMLIPTTIAETTFKILPVGWLLNVEVDLVGKYLERLVRPFDHKRT